MDFRDIDTARVVYRDTLGAGEAGERQHGWTGGLGLLPEVPAQVDEVTATGMNADRTKFSKNFPRTVPYLSHGLPQ